MFLYYLVLLLLINPVHAEDSLKLQLPIQCKIGEECFAVNFPMHKDSSNSQVDYHCGRMSQNENPGTLFMLADNSIYDRGISVLAAADGKITKLQNFHKDLILTKEDRNQGDSKNSNRCGNGVAIKHSNGWETYYCKMKQNSIIVKEGQEVKAGDKLGLAGRSGWAFFPQLHFTVAHNNKVIDPYTSTELGTKCNGTALENTLWEHNPEYKGTGLIKIGFLDHLVDDVQDLWTGKETIITGTMPKESPALILAVHLYGVLKDDTETATTYNPDGSIFNIYENAFTKDVREYLSLAGRKKPRGPFKTGIYKTHYVYERAGKELFSRDVSIEMK